MSRKVMTLLEEMTGGKSYNAHKYGLDHAERPSIDYSEDGIVWQETAETFHYKNYVPLWKLRLNHFFCGMSKVGN